MYKADDVGPGREFISYLTLRRVVGILGVLLPAVLAVGCIVLGACSGILESISANIFYLGEAGMGASVKLVNNMIVLCAGQLMQEGVVLGTKAVRSSESTKIPPRHAGPPRSLPARRRARRCTATAAGS